MVTLINQGVDSTFLKKCQVVRNSGIKDVVIDDSIVRQHDKLLLGGIWAILDIAYDPEIKIGNKSYPFLVQDIKPIHVSNIQVVFSPQRHRGRRGFRVCSSRFSGFLNAKVFTTNPLYFLRLCGKFSCNMVMNCPLLPYYMTFGR